MAIHNDSLIRVVHVARGVGALLIANGALSLTLAVISVTRQPSQPWPWNAFVAGLITGLLAGGALMAWATRLDHGTAWAFYAISGLAGAGTLWSGASLLMGLNPRTAVILMLMLLLETVCGIAWPQVGILRKRKAYTPLAPIPSTAVVIPPPPVRDRVHPLQP